MTTSPHEQRLSEDFGFHRTVGDESRSSLRKYEDLVVGERGLGALLRHELLLGTIAFVPGLAGLWLRQKLYRFLLRHIGRGVVIGRSVAFRHPGKIAIGDRSAVDDYAVLSALGGPESEIVIGERVFVGRHTVLKTRGGRIRLADDADIGPACRIGTTQKIEIGRYVLVAANCSIGLATHEFADPSTPIALQGLRRKGGVVIEEDVWLSVNVVVLDGVRIGRGSVVGAGSVVTKDVPPYSIAVGIPARVTGSRT